MKERSDFWYILEVNQFLSYNWPPRRVDALSNAIDCNPETPNPLTLGVHLRVQDYVGSRVQTRSVLAISVTDLVQRNIKNC